MIGPTRGNQGIEVWVATTPVDMRKSFDGLAEVVRSFLGHDPLSGSLFVFRNRNAQRVKILWWDPVAAGLTIYYKRLERGTFPFPLPTSALPDGAAKSVSIDRAQLMRLLSGLELTERRAS